MKTFLVKRATIIVIVFIAILIVVLVFFALYKKNEAELINTTRDTSKNLGSLHTVIGKSVEARKINAYTYGGGKTHLLFVGGIHGGYEWNSVVLAYKFIDYIETNPEIVPKNLTVTIVPSLNPDGVYKIIGKEGRFTSIDVPTNKSTTPGRFNAHGVDLNRNFDCKWKPTSMWGNTVVSAGIKPFSEPEAEALRVFIIENNPNAVIFWHSQSNTVYASQCENGILPETLKIMNLYAEASGYDAVPFFDAYKTTGDAEAWLASIGIPSITVELKTHEHIEWKENLKGIKALFEYYNLITI